MTDDTRENQPTDAELVAWLDGELPTAERGALEARLQTDVALKARLDHLAAGGRPFAEAFDTLLAAAPAGRLEDILAQARIRAARGGAMGGTRTGLGRRRFAAVAAGLLIFAAGAAVGFGLPRVVQRPEEIAETSAASDWREVVAEYLTLYSNETLADIPEDAAQREKELATVAGKLALDMSPDKVALPELTLKRAQLFDLEGRPLAQIAYLSSYGPVAFCVIADDQGDAGREFEERHGRGIVYWSKGGHAFMLIGKVPRPQLEALAARLERQMA